MQLDTLLVRLSMQRTVQYVVCLLVPKEGRGGALDTRCAWQADGHADDVAQAATNTKEVADRMGDAAVQMAKEVAPKIKPAADRFSEQAESAAQRVAEEAPRRIDKASEVRGSVGAKKCWDTFLPEEAQRLDMPSGLPPAPQECQGSGDVIALEISQLVRVCHL